MYNLYGIMPIMRCTLEYIQKEYFELDKTWDESKEFCKTWGGRLATVSSFSENQYMIRRLGEMHLTSILESRIGQFHK
ncbi:uncharacterized protein LOC127729344 isoform X2 [Mytilus californianus]|uniref:uncharacterized protein LOC127729344 isoform X2 n=1 Tax=Mytilus californianus TaxID=6549 RepID=UPI002247CE28|nr:uncharacterized protein LOC127729344 isoform X2 [Mytilus californianus]